MALKMLRNDKNRALSIRDALNDCYAAVDRETFMAAYRYWYYLKNNRPAKEDHEPVKKEIVIDPNEPGWMKQLEKYIGLE